MGSMDSIIGKQDPILQSPPPSTSMSVQKTPAPSRIPRYTSPSATPNTARRKKETLLKEASSYCSKGCSEWKLKRAESAMEAFTSALLILETVLGTFHLLTAKTYFWIGFILQKSSGGKSDEEFRRCLEAFSMAFRIRLRLCGSKHKSTEEARQAVRWAFRKISESNGTEHESIDDFLSSIEKSLRYEVQGEKKVVAKDYSSALICFDKAFQTAEQWEKYARPTPQLLNRLGDCYSSLGETKIAIFWFRRALLDIYSDAFHREKHPVVEMVYEQMKKIVPAESMKDYIQMVASSMQHVKLSQESTNGWDSQEELLKAIQLELLYEDSNHPFITFLLGKIDLNVIQEELNMQIQVADDGILQLALSFDRKDSDASKRLELLDAFQKRAASCLEIAKRHIDSSTVPSNRPFNEAWSGQEGKWLCRQVHVVELLQLRVSDLNGKTVKKSTGPKSDRVESLRQDLARLSYNLSAIQDKLNISPSKLQNEDRESLISQMVDTQQEIAFREGQLELELQSSEEESRSSAGSNHPCESLVKLEKCLREAKQDHEKLELHFKEIARDNKSSFWNEDSFEAGLWKHPIQSLQEQGNDIKMASNDTKRGARSLIIQTDQADRFASFDSPKVFDATDGATSQTKLDNALRDAEELRQQIERNNMELENAKAAMESCQRMLDQCISTPGTEKSFLIKNLLAASQQEVDHFSRKNAELEDKLHAVQMRVEETQRQVKTFGEPSCAASGQGSETAKTECNERPDDEIVKSVIQDLSPATINAETQGVLSHAPSIHKSLASAMHHLDAGMDRKLQESFHGIDTFFLNPNAAESDLSSTMQTARKQALRRLDGCYGEMTTREQNHRSFTPDKTPMPSVRSAGASAIRSKGTPSNLRPEIVTMERIQKRIRHHKYTFYSPSGKFIMRRPSIDIDKWGDIPVSKEYNANIVCPETIDVMISIAYDGSTLLLSSDSVVQHRGKDGAWNSLGPIDQRDVPFGWIKYVKGSGRRHSSYSLDEILEEANVFRGRYCDSIVNPKLSLVDIIFYNKSSWIFVMLVAATVLSMLNLKLESCVSPLLGL